MRSITALMAASVVMAVGAAPAYASLPSLPDSGQTAGITQGDPTATGGKGYASGGDGGDANTGNTQVLNGNAVALSVGDEAKAEGGNTSAKSGDAYGGDGGNAKATGGDARASNEAEAGHGKWSGDGSSVVQGKPEAKGGKAKATGGDGGNADTGNKQVLNGNSVAVSLPDGGIEKISGKGGRHEGGAKAEGGDTSAKSGDAYGGDGGDAKASGGDAHASNEAKVESDRGHGHDQSGDRCKRHEKGSRKSSSKKGQGSSIEQGDPKAKGGKAKAWGGDGGDADTGNTQFGNGNALALPLGGGRAKAEGGNTCAESGDAYGGDGGDAKAIGGDAEAWNYARAFELNAPWKGSEL
jgi:hypothetical protein